MKAVVQWVLKTMMKDQTGVMRTLPKKDLVDFNVAMTAERLARNGIDPNALKNVNQVENAINQIENAPRNVQQGIRSTKSAKVFDMEGKEIPPGSRIMGGKELTDSPLNDLKSIVDDSKPINEQTLKEGLMKTDNPFSDLVKTTKQKPKTIKEREAEVLAGMEKNNKEAVQRIKNRKMVKDAIDNASPGFVKGDRKYNAQLVAEDLAEKKFGKEYYDLDQTQQLDLYDEALDGYDELTRGMPDPDDFAQGGRAGFKEGSGMTRRSFLKILGGLAAIPIVGKFLKPIKLAKGVKNVPIIKTENVAGKPEWFDALVNKVIIEGDDVTKKFATAERQSIHQKTLDDGSVVRVTEDVDDGAVRVEYESDESMFGEPVGMQYKKPLPDEGAPNPAAEFEVSESGIVGRADGPDDFVLEGEGMSGSSIRELESDVSKLKQYATGKGPTMKEIVEIKKRKDKVRRLNEGDPSETSQYVTDRQGDYDPSPDDFASGGIARMLGE